MTVIAKTLFEATQAAIADATLYTAPANTRTIVDKFTATNVTGVAATLTVNLVQAAGAVAATNVLISAQSVAAGASYLCPEIVGHILNPGDFLSVKASAAAAINVRGSGREIS